MFVLEALTLTFMTTPLVTFLYPPERRVRVAASGANFNNVDRESAGASDRSSCAGGEQAKTRFTVVLDKIDHMPGMMALAQLVRPWRAPAPASDHPRSPKEKAPPLFIDALRLIELSDRTSAVMKSSAADSLLHTDPLLGIFRMFGELNDLPVSTSLAIVTFDALAYSVAEHARNNGSEMIMVPWLPPGMPTGDAGANDGAATPRAAPHASNPFDALFKSSAADKPAPAIHSQFVRGVFAQSTTDVALFIDQARAPGAAAGSMQHIFLPFFGGPDDRLALEFAVQLCANPQISASVVRITKRDVETAEIGRVPAAYLGDDKGAEDANMFTVASVGLWIVCARMD